MPEICRFLGIIITMYADDYNHPHFHVRYNEFRALFLISNGNGLEGEIPNKQLSLIQAWIELHRKELMFNW